MDKREELKKALEQLIEEAQEITNLAAGAKKLDILQFGTEYQNWYTKRQTPEIMSFKILLWVLVRELMCIKNLYGTQTVLQR